MEQQEYGNPTALARYFQERRNRKDDDGPPGGNAYMVGIKIQEEVRNQIYLFHLLQTQVPAITSFKKNIS